MGVLKFVGGYVTASVAMGLILAPAVIYKANKKAEKDFNSSKEGKK